MRTSAIHLRRYPWGLHLVHRASDGTGHCDSPIASLCWRNPRYSFFWPRALWSALLAVWRTNARRARIDPAAEDLRFFRGAILAVPIGLAMWALIIAGVLAVTR